jgi:NADH-ubiquinone oxidoreductase chain 6
MLNSLFYNKEDLLKIEPNVILTYNDGINPSNLDLISFLAILSSILVVTTSNPVISVLFLISLFINVAVYLVVIGITFIGLTYIVVYVGAVTILFLFVIMLLDIKFSEIHLDNNNNNFPIGIIIGLTFLYPLIRVVPKEIMNKSGKSDFSDLFNWMNSWLTQLNYEEVNLISSEDNSISLTNLLFSDKILFSLWDNSLFTYTQVTSLGHIMYSSYLIWFIMISLILLLAMVGAITLTLKTSQ